MGNFWIPRSEQQSVPSMRVHAGMKMEFWTCPASLEQSHLQSVLLAVGQLPPQYKAGASPSQYCALLKKWFATSRQWIFNGKVAHEGGNLKCAFISPEPPGVLIRTFLANNQTGNCSLTAGNFHHAAVNLCIRVSSFSLTWRVIPIRQQLILIIQSIS